MDQSPSSSNNESNSKRTGIEPKTRAAYKRKKEELFTSQSAEDMEGFEQYSAPSTVSLMNQTNQSSVNVKVLESALVTVQSGVNMMSDIIT